jgi:acid phosphatase type 7
MRASATAFLVGLAVVAAGSPDLTAQVVQITRGPVIETASNNSATIAWSTNQPSDSRVWYGTDKDNLTQTAEAGAAATTHRVQLNNLAA